jgi:hypothetical protein
VTELRLRGRHVRVDETGLLHLHARHRDQLPAGIQQRAVRECDGGLVVDAAFQDHALRPALVDTDEEVHAARQLERREVVGRIGEEPRVAAECGADDLRDDFGGYFVTELGGGEAGGG